MRRPNNSAMQEATIKQLRSHLEEERTLRINAESAMAAMEGQLEETESDCPECDDLCALERAASDAECDVKDRQRFFHQELMTCKTSEALSSPDCPGLLDCVRRMVEAGLRLSEFDLAVGNYNLAYCRARYAADHMEAAKCELEDILAGKPDLTYRAETLIGKAKLFAR